MSETQAVPRTLFSASETAYLHGERFAGAGGMMKLKEELLTTGAKVAADELAESVLAALVLSHEEAGSIRLEARSKKVLFGLMTRRTLYADRLPEAGEWPEGSLESQLRAYLRGDATEVDDLLHDLLQEDVPQPSREVLERVKRGLAARGLLEQEEVKRLKIFTTYQYRLPDTTAGLARAHAPDAVRRLLDECQRSRPEVWQLLRKHIGSALARRKEIDNDHDFND